MAVVPLNGYWKDPASGAMMRALRIAEHFVPRDPHLLTTSPNPYGGFMTELAYGCGCLWEADVLTAMQGSHPPMVCPNHDHRFPQYANGGVLGVGPYDPSGGLPPIGYAMGGAVSGGSLNVTLSSANPYYAPYAPSQPEPPRELELTFETEPIVGWRMWRVVTHHLHGGLSEPRLQPLTGRNLWEPRKRYAGVCLPGPQQFVYGTHGGTTHEAPGRNCECGTWAVRDRKDLPTEHPHGLCAIGEVHLWGRVLEFKKGWRAKYAYPKSLTLLADDQAMADDLARLYGVEVALDPPAPSGLPGLPGDLYAQTASERMLELLQMYGPRFSITPPSFVQGTEP